VYSYFNLVGSHQHGVVVTGKPPTVGDILRNEEFLICILPDADGRVKHWHVTSSACLSTVVESQRQTLACAFNSSVSHFVTAGSDTKIMVYDEKTKKLLTILEPRYVFPGLLSIVGIH